MLNKIRICGTWLQIPPYVQEDAGASAVVDERQLAEIEKRCHRGSLDQLVSSQAVSAQLPANSSAQAEDGEVAELSTECVSSSSVPDWLNATRCSHESLSYSDNLALRNRLQGMDDALPPCELLLCISKNICV